MAIRRLKNAGVGANWVTWQSRFVQKMDDFRYLCRTGYSLYAGIHVHTGLTMPVYNETPYRFFIDFPDPLLWIMC